MGVTRMPAMAAELFLILITSFYLNHVDGHGMITDPPARNAMWRYGYTNPVNYNDNELYCGGFSVQWNQNDGKCGVCGDNFELKICPVDGKKSLATQDCFDKHPLVLADNPRSHQFYVPLDSPKITKFNYQVVLPYGLTCSQCVIQWTYYTGNTWGVCANGTEGMGCGYQETFRNCADVQINSIIGAYPPNAFAPTRRTIYQRTRDGGSEPLVVTAHVCVATDQYSSLPGMDDWCQKSCLSYPPSCPRDKCKCLSHCEAIGRLAGVEGTDVFCHRNCLRYPPNCPKESCKCHAAEDAVSVPDGDAIVDTRLTPKYLQFLSGYGVIPIA